MNYLQSQRNPSKHLVGIGLVILLHIVIIWALMNGLARKVVQLVKAPIETKIIEEVKPPPPPPPKIELAPPPKFVPPPPAFVPPPEVVVKTPPPPQTTITPTIEVPPPAPPPVVAPRVEAPPAPPAPAPAPAPAAPVSAAVACSNHATVLGEAAYPREAARLGLEKGEVQLQFTLGANGEIKDIRTLKATHQTFARAAARQVSELKCAGQGRDVQVTVEFGYKMN